MTAAPTYLVSDLVAAVRTDSDLNASQVYTDDEIATLISDAGSDLRDLFTQTNQHYDIATFDFSLSGGLGDAEGVNSIDLSITPGDFQQGHSVDVNPNTAQPYTLRYLSNWLDRNRVNTPASIFGPAISPKEYYFLGSRLLVLPPMNAGGLYRLYYTPTWKPLALPASITVDTVPITIPIVSGHTGFTAGLTFKANDLAPASVFLPTDVGNFITVTGAVNSGNNGSRTIGGPGVISANEVGFSATSGLVAETLPDSATATLSRASFVTATGVWTFYGDSEFTQTTGSIHAGDTINVTGAANAGNNGAFVVLSVGLNTVTTASTGLVAENFATGTVTVTAQAAGTRPDLPTIMNPWILYLKTIACITIRNKRGQEVDAFERRLAVQKQRIETILQERQEEPTQPPLTRGSNDWGGGFMGGGW